MQIEEQRGHGFALRLAQYRQEFRTAQKCQGAISFSTFTHKDFLSAMALRTIDIDIFADYSIQRNRTPMPQQLAKFKAEFFKALAHPVRIRILDCLRDGEKGVNELSEALQIEPANVSQQLAILRVRNIVIGRKEGSNVYYSVSDRALFKLLDVAKTIFNNHLVGVREMLQEMEEAS